MSYEEFEELISRHKEREEKYLYLAELGINLFDIDENYIFIFDKLLNAFWSPEGVEWIYWFIEDSDYGKKVWDENDVMIHINNEGEKEEIPNEFDDGYGAHNAKGEPICYDIKSLYDYVKQYEKPTYDVIKNPTLFKKIID